MAPAKLVCPLFNRPGPALVEECHGILKHMPTGLDRLITTPEMIEAYRYCSDVIYCSQTMASVWNCILSCFSVIAFVYALRLCMQTQRDRQRIVEWHY